MEDQHSAENRLQVPADATIRNAEALKDLLLGAIREAPGVVLDLSCVESVDMSFFQIVGAGQRLAHASGKTLRLDQVSASEPVREAVTLAGFSRNADCYVEAGDICLWKEED